MRPRQFDLPKVVVTLNSEHFIEYLLSEKLGFSKQRVKVMKNLLVVKTELFA